MERNSVEPVTSLIHHPIPPHQITNRIPNLRHMSIKKGFSILNYKQCSSEFNKNKKKLPIFLCNTYPVPNFRLYSIQNKKVTSLELNFFQLCIGKNVWDFQKKMMNAKGKKKKKDHFSNQIFENSRTLGNFENCVPPPPNWHHILKPITRLVAIFYYMYKLVYTFSK